MSAAPLLAVDALRVEFRTHGAVQRVLRGVSLDVGSGEIVGLVGESGGGKTMVGKAVLDVLPEQAHVTGGSIRFDGRELLTMPARERRGLLGRSMSMILQNPMTALNPVRRIGDQVAEVLRRHLGERGADALDHVRSLLAAVGIREPGRVMRQYPHELSGGMCQRVVIAIAFACRPRLIIADEPTTALDVTIQHQVLHLIKRLQRETGTAVLFVTHDLGVVAKLCDRVNVVFAGSLVESADVATLFARPSHPYTAALLQAAPRYDQPDRRLAPVPEALRRRLIEEIEADD